MVIAGMLLASRDIVGGIEWVASQREEENIGKLAEKQKKKFAGCEIAGKKLGIIGLGAIGVLVANAATHLGMDVMGYDPYISVEAAWNLSRTIHHIKDVEQIYRECDYITIHVPLNDSTTPTPVKYIPILFCRAHFIPSSGIEEKNIITISIWAFKRAICVERKR